jgi:hypothetical protein
MPKRTGINAIRIRLCLLPVRFSVAFAASQLRGRLAKTYRLDTVNLPENLTR